MPRKKAKPQQTVEDVSNADIQLRCSQPECGHQFSKKGAWLQRNRIFGCPKCGRTIALDDEEVLSLFSKHVEKVRNMIRRMRGE